MYNAASFDYNGLFYVSEDVYGPWMNGIPDAAEFALLQSILMDIMHPNHSAIRAKWVQARASVFADVRNGAPPGSQCEKKLKLDAKILAAMAAYRCLGYESNVASNIYFGNKRSFYSQCTPHFIPLQTLWPNPLPPLLPAPLAPNGDLDGDGFTNAEEWGWAWAGFPDYASRQADYLLYASTNALRPAERIDVTIPNHPHTSIIIMRKVGEGTIYPPVGEYDYLRFMSNDPLCPNAADCGSFPIRVGAEAAPGWVFRRWWGEPDIEETNLTIDSTQPHTMVAEFVYRPGLAAIDLVADLDYALDIWDESEIFWLLEDKNRLVRGVNGAPDTFAPNGIPDVFEIALLQETLKKVNLDLSRRSGVVHQEVWDMWQANLAQLTSDLPAGTDPRIARVLAAYMCIGDRGSIAWAQHMAQTHHSTTLDTADYEGQSVFFAFDEDADNDGTINQKEWFGAVDLLDPLEDNLEIFLTYALDPKLEGIPGVAGGKEAESAPDCGTCVGKITITAEAQPIEGGNAEITEATPDNKYPLGKKINVHAEANPDWRFVNWSCNDCLINGSRIADETLLVTPVEGNTMGLVAHFEQNIIVVPAPPGTYNLGLPGATVTYSYSRDPELQFDGSWAIRYDGEDPVTLSAHFSDHQLNWNNGRLNNPPPEGEPIPEFTNPQAQKDYEVITRWENQWGGPGSSTPEYAWGDTVTVLEGSWGADPFLIKKKDKIEINIESNVGHVTLGKETGAVLAISPAMFPLTRDSGPEQSYNLDVGVGYAPPGYEFCCFTPALPPEPRSYADWMGVSAVFEKKVEYALNVNIEGCGWVDVARSAKYYYQDELVNVSVFPAFGYYIEVVEINDTAQALNNNYSFLMTQDTTLDVVLKPIPPFEVEYNAFVVWEIMDTYNIGSIVVPHYFEGDIRLFGGDSSKCRFSYKFTVDFNANPMISGSSCLHPTLPVSRGYASAQGSQNDTNCYATNYKLIRDGSAPISSGAPDPNICNEGFESAADYPEYHMDANTFSDLCNSASVHFEVTVGPGDLDQYQRIPVPELDVDKWFRFSPDGDGVPILQLNGSYDGFPWYEIKVNDAIVWSYDPCVTGENPLALGGGLEESVDENIRLESAIE